MSEMSAARWFTPFKCVRGRHSPPLAVVIRHQKPARIEVASGIEALFASDGSSVALSPGKSDSTKASPLPYNMDSAELRREISTYRPGQSEDRRTMASNILRQERVAMYIHCVKFTPTVCELQLDAPLETTIMPTDSAPMDRRLNAVPLPPEPA